MSNWTDFFAKFSGSYLTIAEELRDDTAITDITHFHELRSLVESGLASKLAALTSTGTGFLHEWATFLDTEKGDVATGTQGVEPSYSDSKWSAFETEFTAGYANTIKGLRNDLKHSDFATWTDYINKYGNDYQGLITAFQNEQILGYADLDTFLIASQTEIHSKLMGLNSASNFIAELATLLNAKKTGLNINSTWTDFKNNFDGDWQQMITKLELDLTGVTWANFYEKDTDDYKQDLVGSGNEVFSGNRSNTHQLPRL